MEGGDGRPNPIDILYKLDPGRMKEVVPRFCYAGTPDDLRPALAWGQTAWQLRHPLLARLDMPEPRV